MHGGASIPLPNFARKSRTNKIKFAASAALISAGRVPEMGLRLPIKFLIVLLCKMQDYECTAIKLDVAVDTSLCPK